jgi:CubicO group peptidase (beta-lactamase class C family)
MEGAKFHTDKVELGTMAGQHIPAKIMRQAGFGLTNSPSAFGHDGVGGKFVWGDPETGISFAFVTNTFSSNGACLIRSMELSTLANNATLEASAASL